MLPQIIQLVEAEVGYNPGLLTMISFASIKLYCFAVAYVWVVLYYYL